MCDPAWRWALPPLPLDAGSIERHEHRRAETVAHHRIRWIWNEVASGTGLTRRIVPTGTVTREPPRIGPITLGPPTRFSVELRPGQLIEDLEAIRTRLAAAYEVDDVVVRRLAHGWATVLLVEHEAGATTEREDDERVAPPTPRHFPRRRRRGPNGRPRHGT